MSKIENEKAPLLSKKSDDDTVKSKKSGLNITVEPCMFCVSFAFAVTAVFETNLLIQKSCQENFNEEICKSLNDGNFTTEQNFVQEKVSRFTSYISWIEYIPAILVLPILGAWNDFRGKKIPLMLPLIGMLITSSVQIASGVWMNLPSWVLIIAHIPIGITGGTMGFFMMVYAYISKNGDSKSRTTRFAYTAGVLYCAIPIATIVSNILFKKGGYPAVFGCQGGLILLNLLYIAFCIKDIIPEKTAKNFNLCDLFSPRSIIRPIQVIAKSRKDGKRIYIIINLFIVGFLIFVLQSFKYYFLFVQKKFGWDYEQYNYWIVIKVPIEAIGGLVFLPVLSYRFNVRDCVIGFIGSISAVASYLCLALASTPMMMYVAAGVSICSSCGFSCVRSHLSKLVGESEHGSIFASIALIENLMPLVGAPIFTLVYNTTLTTYPGAIYALLTGTSFICAVLFGSLIIMTSKEK